MQHVENPYASPNENSVAAAVPSIRQIVKKRLFQPAIVTLVAGAILGTLMLINFAMMLLMALFIPESGSPFLRMLQESPWLLAGIISISLGSIVCVYGGIQMLRLRQYPACILAAILMMIPFTSPCMWIGLVIGIWTLVVLLQKETRAAFAQTNQRS